MTDIVELLRAECPHDVSGCCREYGCVHQLAADEIERLRAALASKSAPAIDASAGCVEPVAWLRWEWNRTGLKYLVFEKPETLSLSETARGVVYDPLYAAPQQQRQPLTLERICELQADCTYWSEAEQRLRLNAVEFARAVEAAHGIKETK